MRCVHALLSGLLILCAALVSAQTTIQGRVVDERTLERFLAFVNVSLVDAREGAMTDIDGRFALRVNGLPATLRFSYVGYRTVDVVATDDAVRLVKLPRAVLELREFTVLPGENPAHRIIKRVYANRKENDGMRHRNHRYTSYSKTIFTGAVDSAILRDPERMAELTPVRRMPSTSSMNNTSR